MSESPAPWTNEPDRPSAGRYRRIYDADRVSVARVYGAADAQLITEAPALQEFCQRISQGYLKEPSAILGEAIRLFLKSGGVYK